MGKGYALWSGVMGGFASITAINWSLEYISEKSAVFQYHINRAPELTDLVLKEAREAANDASTIPLWRPVVLGTLAGYFFVRAYQHSQQENKPCEAKEEKK